jgi:hypothetical protein
MPENDDVKTPIDPDALAAAREQAEDFDSFLRPLEVPTREGVWKVVHPNMLDDDATEEYQQMRWEFNQCDRITEDVPEMTLTLKDGTTTTTAAHTIQGGFVDPYQKDGQRMAPSYNVRQARILLGDQYDEFKAAGGTANAIAYALIKRGEEMRKRRESDSKSDGGNVVSEAVAKTD